MCNLFGHDAYTFMLRDPGDLKRTLGYIGSAGWFDRPTKAPVFVHLSTHGDGDGLFVGPKQVLWKKLGEMLISMLEGMHFDGNGYPGPTILVISACDSRDQSLTRYLAHAFRKGRLNSPPLYVFLIADPEVYWADAVVSWTIFYRAVLDLDFVANEPSPEVKTFLENLRRSEYGNLVYFRWDSADRRYLRFPKRDD